MHIIFVGYLLYNKIYGLLVLFVFFKNSGILRNKFLYQRFEKYSNKSMKTEDAVKIERIIRLVDEGKDISREAAEKIER